MGMAQVILVYVMLSCDNHLSLSNLTHIVGNIEGLNVIITAYSWSFLHNYPKQHFSETH